MDIYQSITERTGGDIYIGVVGPVRTGKSTFISRFMDALVLPNIKDQNVKIRATDEMPQSGSGKLIMTMQPRFVPSDAVELSFGEKAKARVRLVDCVGYLVKGAVGHSDGDTPRLVQTPWSAEPIPFARASEIGTNKVITEHSTIGVLVTTDGSIADIERENYIEAEERIVVELKQLNKPFVIVLNSANPEKEETKNLAKELEEKYSTRVILKNVQNMAKVDFEEVLKSVLYEFPVKNTNFALPEWMRSLPETNQIINRILDVIKKTDFTKMSDFKKSEEMFVEDAEIEKVKVQNINLSNGDLNFAIDVSNLLFYKTISEITGVEIANDYDLMSFVEDSSVAKVKYEKLANALQSVEETGYGVVLPTADELKLDEPEIVKRAGNSGVKLKAHASSLHIMKVDVETEVTPAVGGVGFSEPLALDGEVTDETKLAIWNTNMFGKSLSELALDGIVTKVQTFPEEAQIKMRRTLSKITNEGKGGIICILL